MPAGVVGSIGGLSQANIEASWPLVPTINGIRADRAQPRRVDRMPRQQIDPVGQTVRQRRRRRGALELELARGAANSRCGSALSVRFDGATPSRARNSRACRARVSRSAISGRAGLCAIARVNNPSAAGLASSAKTEVAPADSPNTVTRSGSPPNAAMLSRTQGSAAIWSRRHEVVVEARPEVAELEAAEHPEPVGDVDDDDVAVGGQPRTVVELELAGAV